MNSYRRSTLALAVLCLLGEVEQQAGGALHPYRMQQLIKARGKDEVVNVGQRASLYRTIDRLRRSGLIEAQAAIRDAKRPERTMYSLTPEGRRVWREWILDALATPTRDFPEFPAAIAFIPLLTPAEVLSQLEKRQLLLERELTRIETEITTAHAIPRLFVLEMEYLHAATSSELEWVSAVIKDLRSGDITWSEEQLRAFAEQSYGGGQPAKEGTSSSPPSHLSRTGDPTPTTSP